MNKIISIALLCLSSSVLANSACDSPQNGFDDLYCLNKVYQAADTELNAAYKKLKGQLDNSGKDLLKTGQLTWIDNRNRQCSRYEGGEFYVNLDCAAKTTIERLQFLQDRSRECASSGCQNSKL
jgi:uncharacterized protein YecT (DUF1311 family)